MTDERHLNRELLEAVARGDLLAHEIPPQHFLHLIEACPTCRDVFRDWQAELAERHDGRSFGPVLDLMRGVEPEDNDTLAAEAAADDVLRQLLAVEPEQRRRAVEGDRERFGSPRLAHKLLERSRRAMPDNPDASRHFAELALAVAGAAMVAEMGEADPVAAALEVLVRARIANALRAEGDLRAAERQFEVARTWVRIAGIGDVLVLAELDSLEGSLRKDQQRFEGARVLLNRAALRYRIADHIGDLARCTLTFGELQRFQGEPAEAAATVREVLPLLADLDEPQLELCALHNLALYLCDAGDPVAARGLLAELRPRYAERPEPWTQLRLTWLEGRIASGLGDLEEAEAAFRWVVEGFVEQGVGYDAALAALDLAEVFHVRGRRDELAELAADLAPVFRSHELHREATAALVLFQQAARQRMVTGALLEHLRSYLERARSNPELRFEPLF